VIVTMDTGITANEEALYCRERGVQFVCTDHHKIQPEKMPDCRILNPKLHPDPLYQELCGCGITFVLLRKLAELFPTRVDGGPIDWPALWTDLLALVGMTTICDVVPLNGVNHRLAKMGVGALMKSRRPVLRRLREAASKDLDESDVGFRLGPRINAVGRLEHADLVIQAFIDGNPEPLVAQMGECNDRRKRIQAEVLREAREMAKQHADSPVLFLGGEWHPGVVGIVASKIAEEFWRPTFLFGWKDGLGKGSARSLPGVDVTDLMRAASDCFVKFGGHAHAGGFTFEQARESELRARLVAAGEAIRGADPAIWVSQLAYDCALDWELASLELVDRLHSMKPFGNHFEEPRFCVEAEIVGVSFYRDKETGEPKHTAATVRSASGIPQKVMFFNEVHTELSDTRRARFVVSAARNTYKGVTRLSLMGLDYERLDS
jgi:single-stranded-DNA-specific exonuclease